MVLECDGVWGCLAAAVTCASVALVDAGIEMRDSLVGCSMGLPSMMLDMTSMEEEEEEGFLFLAYAPNLGRVAHMVMSGSVKVERVVESMEVGIDACLKIYESVRGVMKN